MFITGYHLLLSLVLNWTANDKHGDLAVMIDEHIHDFADFGVRGVIDALLVPMRNRHRVGRNAGQYLSGGTLRMPEGTLKRR